MRRSTAELEASKAYYKKSIELEDEVAKLRGELKLARDQWNTMDATLTERDAEIKELLKKQVEQIQKNTDSDSQI